MAAARAFRTAARAFRPRLVLIDVSHGTLENGKMPKHLSTATSIILNINGFLGERGFIHMAIYEGVTTLAAVGMPDI